MRRADIPWEFGKYAVALILLVALLRTPRRRRSWMPIAYFALLLPSAILTFLKMDAAEARDQLSFNLSGPLALALCAAFFHSVRFTKRELRWVFVSLLGPVVSIGSIAAMKLAQFQPEEFGDDSNGSASGGFGPNQVSAILGLGILVAVFWLVVGAGNAVASGASVCSFCFFSGSASSRFPEAACTWRSAGSAPRPSTRRDRRTRWRLLAGAASSCRSFSSSCGPASRR